ncbi:hypothetical protein NDU88_009760, partial [Pleurodeles waltl]
SLKGRPYRAGPLWFKRRSARLQDCSVSASSRTRDCLRSDGRHQLQGRAEMNKSRAWNKISPAEFLSKLVQSQPVPATDLDVAATNLSH